MIVFSGIDDRKPAWIRNKARAVLLIIEEVEGDYDCFANFVVWQHPARPAGKYVKVENTNSR